MDPASIEAWYMYIRSCCARMKEGGLSGGGKIWFVTTFDVIKCLKQLKWHRSLLMCTPSHISTMIWRMDPSRRVDITFQLRRDVHGPVGIPKRISIRAPMILGTCWFNFIFRPTHWVSEKSINIVRTFDSPSYYLSPYEDTKRILRDLLLPTTQPQKTKVRPG